MPVDETEVAAAKADDVVAVVELGSVDEPARQRLADEGELPAPFDFGGGADWWSALADGANWLSCRRRHGRMSAISRRQLQVAGPLTASFKG